MYSITSVFDAGNAGIWTDLEKSCEYVGLNKTTIPHFSWQTAEAYQFEPLKKELFSLSRSIRSFKFRTSGLGIFSNHRKILFLIIVKDRALLDLHQRIWEQTIQYAVNPNLLYSPESWIPHISLNLNDLTEDQFLCAVKELSNRSLNFELLVNKLGLIFLTPTTSGIDALYPLSPLKG